MQTKPASPKKEEGVKDELSTSRHLLMQDYCQMSVKSSSIVPSVAVDRWGWAGWGGPKEGWGGGGARYRLACAIGSR